MRRQLIGLLLLCCLVMTGCMDKTYQQESFVFGTRVQLSIVGVSHAEAENAANAVLQNLDRLHQKLHPWQAGSSLVALNQALAAGKTFPLDAELSELIAQSQYYYGQTEGLFNPALGGLVAAWGFHHDIAEVSQPKEQDLQFWRSHLPAMDALRVLQGQARSQNPLIQLDFGGIAKGWALDQSAAILRAHGIKNALINIGGNVMALGQNGRQNWHIGLQHPRLQRAMAELDLLDGEAIGTTGDYQRYFEKNGLRYCHVLDPRTAQPVQGMQSVSIIAPPAEQAGSLSDAGSKPFFIAGTQHASYYAKRLHINQFILIDAQNQVTISAAMQKRLHWLIPPKNITLLP